MLEFKAGDRIKNKSEPDIVGTLLQKTDIGIWKVMLRGGNVTENEDEEPQYALWTEEQFTHENEFGEKFEYSEKGESLNEEYEIRLKIKDMENFKLINQIRKLKRELAKVTADHNRRLASDRRYKAMYETVSKRYWAIVEAMNEINKNGH